MRRKPTYFHELSGWPRLSWKAEALASPLARVRHQQGRLLGRMQSLGFELRSEASLVVLTSEVVTSSAIEGEALDAQAVRSSIARRLGLQVAGLRRADRAVDGIVDMMLDATRRFAEPLTEERLFGWHAALFPTGRRGIERIAVGAWRPKDSDPMQVVSGAFGRERIHFEAPAAQRVPAEMARLLEWFNEPGDTDPVLRAGLAHLWFETIHPFEDGNGRIGRAIADMLLARADGTADRFYSLSSRIEAERKDYYTELEAAQKGGLDVTRWMSWFVGCLDLALSSADVALAAVLHKARIWQRLQSRPVNERQRKVLNRLLDGFQGQLTTSKYARIARCSSDTALRDVGELLDRGVLRQNRGGGRSTSYRLATPEEIRG